jgi:hypothetical protein
MNTRTYNQINENEKNKIIKFYYENKYMDFNDIRTLFNLSKRTLPKILKEANINTKLKNRYVIKNENYFHNIDIEFKAYILGFIYADGFVGVNNDFCIGLSDKYDDNLKILKRLKNELQTDLKIKHSISKDGYGSYIFKFSNKKIVSDLKLHGVFTCKSLTMEDLPILEQNLMHHFIRGYFDGDGTICTYYDNYDNRQRYVMEILGTPIFLNKMHSHICNSCNIYKTKLKNNRVNNLASICHKGIKQLIKIREYLYNDATIFITYKHDKFYDIQPL